MKDIAANVCPCAYDLNHVTNQAETANKDLFYHFR